MHAVKNYTTVFWDRIPIHGIADGGRSEKLNCQSIQKRGSQANALSAAAPTRTLRPASRGRAEPGCYVTRMLGLGQQLVPVAQSAAQQTPQVSVGKVMVRSYMKYIYK